MKNLFYFLIGIALVLPFSAFASNRISDVLQPVGSSGIGFGEVAGELSRGQTFIPAYDNIQEVAFQMGSTGSKGIRIYIGTATGSHLPSATSTATCTYTFTNGQLVARFWRYTLSPACTVTAGTEYYIAFVPWDTALDKYVDDYRDFYWRNSENDIPNGYAFHYTSGAWSTQSMTLQLATFVDFTGGSGSSSSTSTNATSTADISATSDLAFHVLIVFFISFILSIWVWKQFMH